MLTFISAVNSSRSFLPIPPKSATRQIWVNLHKGTKCDIEMRVFIATRSSILDDLRESPSLYKAMKAFGQIIKSLFILRYIDELELANRFTRAVAVGNPREFTQAEKEEQEIAEFEVQRYENVR